MRINKSSRHSKITGDFAERLILYWLSKYGFECAYIDHTGIDIIARNPDTKEVIGISVKSRSRNEGKEGSPVRIGTFTKNDFDKVNEACNNFNCSPYFAIIVDEKDHVYCFLLPLSKLLKMHPPEKSICSWKMDKKHIAGYCKDPEIKIVK